MPKTSKNPPPASVAKPKKLSPSPASASKPKNPSPRRRGPLSDLNSGDAAAARTGCFRFLLSNSKPTATSAPRTPFSAPPIPRTTASRRRNAAGKRSDAAQIKKQEPKKPASKGKDPPFEALTPEKKAEANAPASGATPPIQASISPEVPCGGGAMAATPACFAAGHHVVAGVHDRRKCRPRGILTIAGEGSEEFDAEPSRASIHWLSSPTEAAGNGSGTKSRTCSTKCGNEASVNWLVSPCEEGEVDLLKDEIFLPKCSSDDAFWRFSPTGDVFSDSPVLSGLLNSGTPASEMSETTPSSGFVGVQKTPSTGDSISPFSLILKRVSASSRIKSSSVQQRAGSYRYGSAAERTPFSGESWPEDVSNATCTGSKKPGHCSPMKMDPAAECFKMMSLSPKPGDDDYDEHGALPAPLPELSFQFAHAPTPLNSVDLSCFKRPLCDMQSKVKEASFRKPVLPETRISWREGLVSRIFDMGELDCCKWLSDDEDEQVFFGKDETLPDCKFEPNSGSLLKDGGDKHAACGFGSVEFDCGEIGCRQDDIKVSPAPISVAESMRAEGFELVSSDDSDWALFYKNGLFEI